MTILLPSTTDPLPPVRRSPSKHTPTPGAPVNRRRQVTTAALLRLVDAADDGLELVPVGIAIHSLTEPLREHLRVDRAAPSTAPPRCSRNR